MKKLSLLFILLLTLFACKKDDKDITYPITNSFGYNVLNQIESDTITGSNYDSFGFNANLGKDANLKIIISQQNSTNDFNYFWLFDNGLVNGWNITTVNTSNFTQTFESIETGELYLKIYFPSSSICRIDYYENSENITFSKMLYVE